MWFAGEGAGRSLSACSDDDVVGGAWLFEEQPLESCPLC